MEKHALAERLVQLGLARNKREAVALVLSGAVLVNEQRTDKPGTPIASTAEIRLKTRAQKYVSRGGLKLEAALDQLQIEVQGKICADLGASTGGFTDCLLQRGALRVYAFDVGRGQLDWKLQTDPRVVMRDGFNIRYLRASDLQQPLDLVTIDVSFISLQKVLPAVKALKPGLVLALVKPQFEAARGVVEKGGVIRTSRIREQILEKVRQHAVKSGWKVLGCVPSTLRGQKGNLEYFLALEPDELDGPEQADN